MGEEIVLRTILESKNEYQLILNKEGFNWYKNSKPVPQNHNEELWKKYNPQLYSKLKSIKDKEELKIYEIGDLIKIDRGQSIIRIVAREMKLEVPQRGHPGAWKPIPLSFFNYILAYLMPQIEEWKKAESLSNDTNLSKSSILSMCEGKWKHKGEEQPPIEAKLILKKWYISPFGEEEITKRISQNQRKEAWNLSDIIIQEGKLYYSIEQVGKEAALAANFKEEDKEFEHESYKLAQKARYALQECKDLKSIKIHNRDFFDKASLDLYCDLITQEEAATILGISRQTLAKHKNNYTTIKLGKSLRYLRSEIKQYRTNAELLSSKTQKEIQPLTNQTKLSQSLDKIQTELKLAKSKINDLETIIEKKETPSQNNKLKNEITELKEQLKTANTNYKELTKQYEKDKKKYETQITLLEKKETPKPKENNEIINLKEQLKTANKNYKELNKQYEKEKKKYETKISKLETQQIQHNQDKENTSQELQDTIKQLQSQINTIKEQTTKSSNPTNHSELNDLKYQKKLLEIQLESINKEEKKTIYDLELKVEQLQTKLLNKNESLELIEQRLNKVHTGQIKKEYGDLLKPANALLEALKNEIIPPLDKDLENLMHYFTEASGFKPSILENNPEFLYAPALSAKMCVTQEMEDLINNIKEYVKSGDKRHIKTLKLFASVFKDRLSKLISPK